MIIMIMTIISSPRAAGWEVKTIKAKVDRFSFLQGSLEFIQAAFGNNRMGKHFDK